MYNLEDILRYIYNTLHIFCSHINDINVKTSSILVGWERKNYIGYHPYNLKLSFDSDLRFDAFRVFLCSNLKTMSTILIQNIVAL